MDDFKSFMKTAESCEYDLEYNPELVENLEKFRRRIFYLRKLSRFFKVINDRDFLPVFHNEYVLIYDLLGGEMLMDWLFEDEPIIFAKILDTADQFKGSLKPTRRNIYSVRRITQLDREVFDMKAIRRLMNTINQLKTLLYINDEDHPITPILFFKLYDSTQKEIGSTNLYSFFNDRDYFTMYERQILLLSMK